MQREDERDGYIGDPRAEREREQGREGNAQQSVGGECWLEVSQGKEGERYW